MKPQYTQQNGMQIDGNYWLVHPQTGEGWTDETIAEFIDNYIEPDLSPKLEDVQQQAIGQIKQQAGVRISALDWQLQRAEDRIAHIELTGAEQDALAQAEADLLAVLNKRETIRQASNDAEAEVLTLTDVEKLSTFEW